MVQNTEKIQVHLECANSLIHTHLHRVSEPIKMNEENFLNSILLQIVSNILNANKTVRFFLRRMRTQLFSVSVSLRKYKFKFIETRYADTHIGK